MLIPINEEITLLFVTNIGTFLMPPSKGIIKRAFFGSPSLPLLALSVLASVVQVVMPPLTIGKNIAKGEGLRFFQFT